MPSARRTTDSAPSAPTTHPGREHAVDLDVRPGAPSIRRTTCRRSSAPVGERRVEQPVVEDRAGHDVGGAVHRPLDRRPAGGAQPQPRHDGVAGGQRVAGRGRARPARRAPRGRCRRRRPCRAGSRRGRARAPARPGRPGGRRAAHAAPAGPPPTTTTSQCSTDRNARRSRRATGRATPSRFWDSSARQLSRSCAAGSVVAMKSSRTSANRSGSSRCGQCPASAKTSMRALGTRRRTVSACRAGTIGSRLAPDDQHRDRVGEVEPVERGDRLPAGVDDAAQRAQERPPGLDVLEREQRVAGLGQVAHPPPAAEPPDPLQRLEAEPQRAGDAGQRGEHQFGAGQGGRPQAGGELRPEPAAADQRRAVRSARGTGRRTAARSRRRGSARRRSPARCRAPRAGRASRWRRRRSSSRRGACRRRRGRAGPARSPCASRPAGRSRRPRSGSCSRCRAAGAAPGRSPARTNARRCPCTTRISRIWRGRHRRSAPRALRGYRPAITPRRSAVRSTSAPGARSRRRTPAVPPRR